METDVLFRTNCLVHVVFFSFIVFVTMSDTRVAARLPEMRRYALAQVVIAARKACVLLRPIDRLAKYISLPRAYNSIP